MKKDQGVKSKGSGAGVLVLVLMSVFSFCIGATLLSSVGRQLSNQIHAASLNSLEWVFVGFGTFFLLLGIILAAITVSAFKHLKKENRLKDALKSLPPDQQALEDVWVSSGFLPVVELYERSGIFIHESAHSTLWFFGGMVISGVAAFFIFPAEMLRIIIMLFLLWGGISGLAASCLRNQFGQKIIVDPHLQVITIQKRGHSDTVIEWSDVDCFQICFRPSSPELTTSSYQLNVAWNDNGILQRRCILSAASKRQILTHARKCLEITGLKLCDYSIISDPV